MFLPPIRDDRASGVSRVPSHSGQVWKVMTRSTKRLCLVHARPLPEVLL